MPGPEFFQTRMGQKFYEGTMPRLVEAVNNLTAEMKRQNDLTEQQLKKGEGDAGDSDSTG